jgi:flagellar biosynthesis/type III secretory pathway chaperone
MSAQNTVQSLLVSLSALLKEERDCLQNVRLSDLPNINRKKSEALRRLDAYVHQTVGRSLNSDELEPFFEQVREQAQRNTHLLGAALNGAKSAADMLAYIQTGEPVNRTYTAFGVNRSMTKSKRKNNLLV